MSDFMMEVPAGRTPYSSINKFGRSTAITTGNTWEIWDGNSAYIWPTSATITHLWSAVDSATTQGVVVEIQGLDTNYSLVAQNVTTNASDSTTGVALGTALRRVFRMKVLDASVMDQALRVGPTGKASYQAQISIGNNQTLMAIYTVPAGKTAYMTGYYATANPGGGAPTTFNVSLWATDNVNGYAAQLKHIQGVSADVDAYGRMQHFFQPYYKFTEKTDIILKGSPTGASVDVSAGFDLILE